MYGNEDGEATITIIGGGFTGSSIALQQMEHYRERRTQNDDELPLLTIRIFEKSPATGPGIPYQVRSDALLLNQPVCAMSPFPKNPDDFTNWYLNQHPDGSPYDFATRREYGEYLTQTFKNATESNSPAETGVTIEVIKATASCVTESSDELCVIDNDGLYHYTDALVIADGHQRTDFLTEFTIYDRFFACPFDTDRAASILKGDEDGNIAIIGTAQSMMDTIGFLDDIGYQGQIYAISRNLILPWPYEPEKYAVALPRYEYSVLTADNVRQKKAYSKEALRGLLTEELKAAKNAGYEVGHVLGGYNPDSLMTAGPNGTPPEGLMHLNKTVGVMYGNPTPPKRHELLHDHIKSGRLKLVEGKIDANAIRPDHNGFTFNPADKALAAMGHVSAIFNCAVFTRFSLSKDRTYSPSPVLQSIIDQDWAMQKEADTGAFHPGEQKKPGIYVNGPTTNSIKWGVETFRDDNLATAENSVNYVLEKKKPKPN